jgi:hypothetical protein
MGYSDEEVARRLNKCYDAFLVFSKPFFLAYEAHAWTLDRGRTPQDIVEAAERIVREARG